MTTPCQGAAATTCRRADRRKGDRPDKPGPPAPLPPGPAAACAPHRRPQYRKPAHRHFARTCSVLGGYALLMALVQLSLAPVYGRLWFLPEFWAFTFSCAAAATDASCGITIERPAGATAYATAVIVILSVSSQQSPSVPWPPSRGQFLPAPSPPVTTEPGVRPPHLLLISRGYPGCPTVNVSGRTGSCS